MAKAISNQEALLIEARDRINKVDELKAHIEGLILKEKMLKKAIEGETRAVQDEIALTIKRRKDEIASSYDREIGKDQDKLKRAKAKREKAKNQGIRERIEEETAELHGHNGELNAQLRVLFRQNSIPGFCNSLLYYSLYFTRGIKEAGIFLLTFLFCFLAVPCGIYYAIPGRSYLHLILIYLVSIFVFAGLYFVINNKTKLRHLEALRKGRQIRNQIVSNQKKARLVAHSIKEDRDEALYGLEQFDDEIARLEGQISLTAKRKEEALASFENVTKNILADEIIVNSQNKIDQLTAKYQEILHEKEELEKAVKEQSIYITDNYEVYLGQDFLDIGRLDKLIEIIKKDEAENITEAINIYKSHYH